MSGSVLKVDFLKKIKKDERCLVGCSSSLLPGPEPRGGRRPTGPQCLPAEPVLPGCGSVPGEAPVPLSPPPAPPLSRRSLLPVRVELAGRVRHHGAQRRGHRQRHRLPGVLRRFGFQGGAGQRDCQGPGEFPFLPPRRPSSSGDTVTVTHLLVF